MPVFILLLKHNVEKNGLSFIETSALDASNVEQAFELILKERYKLVAQRQDGEGKGGSAPAAGTKISIAPKDKADGKEKLKCC